jgi:hypothetical protein
VSYPCLKAGCPGAVEMLHAIDLFGSGVCCGTYYQTAAAAILIDSLPSHDVPMKRRIPDEFEGTDNL